MVSEAPPFWWGKFGWQAAVLYPASLIYGAIAGYRMAHAKRVPVDRPVICVGNFTAGGAGKTPTVIALARGAVTAGFKPGLLSRGYGGNMDRTTVVDTHHHRAVDVGDEPLLLAREALTVVSRNRVEGALRLIAEGADVIIMDDGFQSARLAIDYSLVVVDGRRGIGNGMLMPSGPVRAPLDEQLRHLTALLAVGGGESADPFVRRISRTGRPVFEARTEVRNGADFDGRRVLAFAGIADPDKFYRSLRGTGAEVVATRSFADHHHLDDDEIAGLVNDAEREGLMLVTTAKDFVRLIGHHGRAAELAGRTRVLEIDMAFDDPATPRNIVMTAVAACRKRRLGKKS